MSFKKYLSLAVILFGTCALNAMDSSKIIEDTPSGLRFVPTQDPDFEAFKINHITDETDYDNFENSLKKTNMTLDRFNFLKDQNRFLIQAYELMSEGPVSDLSNLGMNKSLKSSADKMKFWVQNVPRASTFESSVMNPLSETIQISTDKEAKEILNAYSEALVAEGPSIKYGQEALTGKPSEHYAKDLLNA